MISNIEIGLFIAVCCYFPLRHLIQIREIRICLIYMIDFGNMRHITVREELSVNAFPSYNIDILCILFFQLLKQFLKTMHHYLIFHLIFLIGR